MFSKAVVAFATLVHVALGPAAHSARATLVQEEFAAARLWDSVEVHILDADTHPTRASVGGKLSFVARAVGSGDIIAGTVVHAIGENDAVAALQRARDTGVFLRIAGLRRQACNLPMERRTRFLPRGRCIELNPVVEVGDHDLRPSFRPILGLFRTDTTDQFRRNRLSGTAVPTHDGHAHDQAGPVKAGDHGAEAPAWPHEFMDIVVEFGAARVTLQQATTLRATAFDAIDGSLLGDVNVAFVSGTEPWRRLAQLTSCGQLRLLTTPLGGVSRSAVAVAAFAVFPAELQHAADCHKQPEK